MDAIRHEVWKDGLVIGHRMPPISREEWLMEKRIMAGQVSREVWEKEKERRLRGEWERRLRGEWERRLRGEWERRLRVAEASREEWEKEKQKERRLRVAEEGGDLEGEEKEGDEDSLDSEETGSEWTCPALDDPNPGRDLRQYFSSVRPWGFNAKNTGS